MIVWLLVTLAGVSILSAVGFIVYVACTEFTPVVKSKVLVEGNGKTIDPARREFTLFTWNTGYAGLGREMDFFYDGGKKTRPSRKQCMDYFTGIQKVIKANDHADFIFLQEVDVYSKRAWYQDEYSRLSALLPGYSRGFALNYDCRFVPVPLPDPMGRVKSGLVTFSSMRPDEATVQYYKSDFPWPTRLVMLRRCYMLFRFVLDNGKNLVIVNLHNSAYDSTGALRERELFVLDSALTDEYRKGNYVVAGGDWNINPHGFNSKAIHQGDLVIPVDPPMPDTFLRGWSYGYDSLNPSIRFTDAPYKKGVSRTTTIDFFVVSPNVEIKNVHAVPMGFIYADHEPVVMKIMLK